METRENVLLGCARAVRTRVGRLTGSTTHQPASDTRDPDVPDAATSSADTSSTDVVASTQATEDVAADRLVSAARTRRRDTESRAWLRNIAAAGVIGTLGLALAGAMATSGTANPTDTAPTANVSVANDVRQADEFSGRQDRADRTAPRGALEDRLAEQQARQKEIEEARLRSAQADRQKQLGESSKKTKENEKRLDSDVPSRMPLDNYTLRARWGEYGVWARWHTGVDLAAPLGSKISAPAAGVVEHAGPGGGAGSWAGCYVVLRHPDGQATLYAHMNCAMSVSVGQEVGAGTELGHVGLTGRTFGPHLHMELYPAGVTPGDIYSSIDPLPWLQQG